MSPTVSPPAASAEASLDEAPPRAASGACCCTTVVVLPASIAPVPSSTATITATTSPPKTPANRFDRPFTTAEGRAARLIRRKWRPGETRVRGDGEEAAQPGERPAAACERAPQRAPVARVRRPSAAGTGVALLAQEPDVAGGGRPGRDLQPALQIGERRARRVVVAEPVERTAQLCHGALSPAGVEMRPAARDRHQPQQGEHERHERKDRHGEEPPPVGCRPARVPARAL